MAFVYMEGFEVGSIQDCPEYVASGMQAPQALIGPPATCPVCGTALDDKHSCEIPPALIG